MSSVFGDRRFGPLDVVLYAVGVAGLAMCLTLVFMGMRAVMDVGGFCADGGPYQIQTHCPEGVPLVMTGGIFGLFAFGGLMVWRGTVLGGPYAGLVALAWPALFLSLGWNFLEYALNPPPGEGVVWGWLIPGVLFVVMGGVPLLGLLPFGRSGHLNSARHWIGDSIALRPSGGSGWPGGSSGWTLRLNDPSFGSRGHLEITKNAADDGGSEDLVTKLERLAALRQSGDLTSAEFEQAKRTLLGGEGAA